MCVQFVPIASHPFTGHTEGSLAICFTHQVFMHIDKVPPSFLLPRLNDGPISLALSSDVRYPTP